MRGGGPGSSSGFGKGGSIVGRMTCRAHGGKSVGRHRRTEERGGKENLAAAARFAVLPFAILSRDLRCVRACG